MLLLHFLEELLLCEARGDVIPRGVQEDLACVGKLVTLLIKLADVNSIALCVPLLLLPFTESVTLSEVTLLDNADPKRLFRVLIPERWVQAVLLQDMLEPYVLKHSYYDSYEKELSRSLLG